MFQQFEPHGKLQVRAQKCCDYRWNGTFQLQNDAGLFLHCALFFSTASSKVALEGPGSRNGGFLTCFWHVRKANIGWTWVSYFVWLFCLTGPEVIREVCFVLVQWQSWFVCVCFCFCIYFMFVSFGALAIQPRHVGIEETMSRCCTKYIGWITGAAPRIVSLQRPSGKHSEIFRQISIS